MNIYQFADVLGLSIGTVSRAINGRPGVSAKTRSRVLRGMDELGFRPNRAAISLASGRTMTVALWSPGLASSYVSSVLSELEAIVERDDYDLVVVDVARKRSDAARLVDLTRWPVDGILALDAEDWLEPVAGSFGALVSMGVYAFQEAVDHVVLDLGAGVEEAVEHMVAEGCSRLAMVVPYSYNTEGWPRRDAYERVIRRHGLTPEYIETPGLLRAQAVDAVRDHCRACGHPDGLFCFNDELGIAAFRALRDLGVAIPADTLIVGCDGIEETRYLDPRLATIETPVREMCALAWGLLRKRMDNPKESFRSHRLAARFAPRASACRKAR